MMRRALIWLVIALAPMLSQAAAPSCLPANVGGSGTAWVGNVNQAGMWSAGGAAAPRSMSPLARARRAWASGPRIV